MPETKNDVKDRKSELRAKLHAKIDMKKTGRMTKTQKSDHVNSYFTKMGITAEQVDQMREIVSKTQKNH